MFFPCQPAEDQTLGITGPQIHPQSREFCHALPTHFVRACSWKTAKFVKPFLPIPFPTPPTLNVHTQGNPCVFIDDIGHADSWDDFQQVWGNASIKSGHTLLGHNVAEQGQHGGFGGSFHWNWKERKRPFPRTHSKLRATGTNVKKSCLLLNVSCVNFSPS